MSMLIKGKKTSWLPQIASGHLDADLNETGRVSQLLWDCMAPLYYYKTFRVAFFMWNLFDFIVKVARWLSKETKPAAIYSSELKRTPDTARTIAKICNLPNVHSP
uniref:Uncharacterized protein n=2 Tax=Aegilops tauschii subsp. strangulata TaxID=200361 RepID=A0A453DJ80_AEGTS